MTLAGTLAVSMAALACTGAGLGPPPTPEPPPGPTSRSSPSPSADPTPDLSRLRVSTTGWKTDFGRASVDLAEFLGGGPPKDGIPAIDEPAFESIAAARDWLADRSPVISVTVEGRARAYPLAVLMWHEIVNDVLNDVPIVVTFCPLCNTGLVFERRLGGVTYDFGTTGNLRYSDLVMYDRQTESWWQQATGQAIVGELTGTQLVFMPAQIVSIADFAAAHPDGDVLSRETGHVRSYGRNPYVGYDTIDQNPFLFDGELDGRLAPMERVVTIGSGGAAVAVPYAALREVGAIRLTVDGQPILVIWTPGTASALDAPVIADGEDIGATGVFSAELDGRILTLHRDGPPGTPVRDLETGSTWSVTGLAISGELEGARLTSLPHGDHFWFAWAAFAPDTKVWAAPD